MPPKAGTTSLLTLHCFTCLSLSHSYFPLILTSFHSQSICLVLFPCFLVGCHISFFCDSVFFVVITSKQHPTQMVSSCPFTTCWYYCYNSFVGVIVMISWLFLWNTYSWSYAAAFIKWFHALSCVSVALLCMHIHFDDPYAFCYNLMIT
jgi:hypothetical protein